MIEWTLEILEWIRNQLPEKWPEVQLRGSATDELSPDGYRIRFRAEGRQYWLVLSASAIESTAVAEVASLLEARDWIGLLRSSGAIAVGVADASRPTPVLHPA
jgi:hypothetical protein